MLGYIIAGFIGAIIGVFAVCLCIVSKHGGHGD